MTGGELGAGSKRNGVRTARCACGSVEIEAVGNPIASVVCYCDSCQEGSRQIETLPHGIPTRDPDGGTAYIMYRKDRVNYSKGAELLRAYKLEERSATNRVVATCCDSAMVMRFDDARHWIPVYRARFREDVPPLQWRICTKFTPQNTELAADVPSFEMYPPQLGWRLLSSKLAMLLGR
jgi:hypothetical protein